MARAARLVFDNGCYHVITRGNQRQKIFQRPADYEVYLDILRRGKKRYKFLLYGYCLMSNHVHLLMDVAEKGSLGKAMQFVNQAYSRYFNFEYKKVGHLWQGRFKSIVVVKDEYLVTCLHYIELNPVRAKIVDDPMQYRWSSYKARMSGATNDVLDDVRM